MYNSLGPYPIKNGIFSNPWLGKAYMHQKIESLFVFSKVQPIQEYPSSHSINQWTYVQYGEVFHLLITLPYWCHRTATTFSQEFSTWSTIIDGCLRKFSFPTTYYLCMSIVNIHGPLCIDWIYHWFLTTPTCIQPLSTTITLVLMFHKALIPYHLLVRDIHCVNPWTIV